MKVGKTLGHTLPLQSKPLCSSIICSPSHSCWWTATGHLMPQFAMRLKKYYFGGREPQTKNILIASVGELIGKNSSDPELKKELNPSERCSGFLRWTFNVDCVT